jgi:hypothetical protein
MATFSVYEQERSDGGVRAGISLNDEPCWQAFEPGSSDDDPALRWYIDVRGEGDAVPEDPVDLHEWLGSAELAQAIQAAANALADRIAAGIDQGGWPVRHQVSNIPEDLRLWLVTSAVRRVDSLEIAQQVRRFGDEFPNLLKRMREVSQVV